MSWSGADLDGSRRRRRRAALALLPAQPRLLLTTPMFDKSWLTDAGGTVPGWDVSEDLQTLHTAHVVVFHLPQVSGIVELAKPAGQIWIGISAECDIYYPQQRDPALLARLDVLANYRQDSDFPLNYTCPATLAGLLRPAPPKNADDIVCAMISNEHSHSGREQRVLDLERALPVHHYGRWRQTHQMPDRGREAKLELLGRYRFHLAYENCIDRDYVTEKWFDCLLAGCVPVYLGAPNIADFAPAPDCYIDATRFTGASELGAHLRSLAASPAAYEAFFAWKRRPLPRRFTHLFEGQEVPFLRRLCAWLEQERDAASL